MDFGRWIMTWLRMRLVCIKGEWNKITHENWKLQSNRDLRTGSQIPAFTRTVLNGFLFCFLSKIYRSVPDNWSSLHQMERTLGGCHAFYSQTGSHLPTHTMCLASVWSLPSSPGWAISSLGAFNHEKTLFLMEDPHLRWLLVQLGDVFLSYTWEAFSSMSRKQYFKITICFLFALRH